MIDETDPTVKAMRAQFEEISARHKASIAQTAAEYEKGEAANKAYQEEVARKEAQMIAQPPPAQPANQWLTRRTAPRPVNASEDASETGYYSNTWMKKD
jgi:L-amino acid N-acyltransferase YncA